MFHLTKNSKRSPYSLNVHVFFWKISWLNNKVADVPLTFGNYPPQMVPPNLKIGETPGKMAGSLGFLGRKKSTIYKSGETNQQITRNKNSAVKRGLIFVKGWQPLHPKGCIFPIPAALPLPNRTQIRTSDVPVPRENHGAP